MSTNPRPVVVGIQREQPELLEYAFSWAQRWGVPLRVVHAYDFLDIASELYSSGERADGAQDVIDAARRHLEQLEPVPLEFSVDGGSAAVALEKESEGAAAVVVGADDVSWLRRLLGEQVARDVAMHAKAPVFVVPQGAKVAELRDMVLALDENRVGEGPIRFAYETAMRTGAQLRVVHVVPRNVYLSDPAKHGARMAQVLDEWRAIYPMVDVTPSLMFGDVEDEALIAASSAQLIVLGRPNEPRNWELFGLRVAEAIVRHSRAPVVVVPANYRP